MNPAPMIWAAIRRHWITYLLFVILVGVATGIGVAISAQEQALRSGSARAADKFDVIIAAPGSQTDVVLAAIYLRPGVVSLLDAGMTAQALNDTRARFSAPLAFGDSHQGSPIVGSIAAFVVHLSGGLEEGRIFTTRREAVVGAAVRARVGEIFHPSHGAPHDHEAEDDGDEQDAHEHSVDLTVVGRMRATGTPWDNAIVSPVEVVWEVHGLPNGHAEGDHRIGPPFEPGRTPGVPAIVMQPQSVSGAYGLRGDYRTNASMAFFPAEVLVKLYDVLGDVRAVMNWLALAAQGLVVLAMLAGVMAILSLHRKQFTILRALGAPRLYIFLCVWGQVAAIAVAGALLGLLLGAAAAYIVSHIFAAQTGIALPARIGPDEFLLVGGMVLFGLVAGTIPAVLAYRFPVGESLRTG